MLKEVVTGKSRTVTCRGKNELHQRKSSRQHLKARWRRYGLRESSRHLVRGFHYYIVCLFPQTTCEESLEQHSNTQRLTDFFLIVGMKTYLALKQICVHMMQRLRCRHHYIGEDTYSSSLQAKNFMTTLVVIIAGYRNLSLRLQPYERYKRLLLYP
jgi:hypothetical protein